MFGVVKIGDKDVPMLAMASCDNYYKTIFHEDSLKALTEKDDSEKKEAMKRLAFVMAKFAELRNRKEMVKLNEGDYLDWLDGFDNADFNNALTDVVDVYMGNKGTTSQEKKDNAQ